MLEERAVAARVQQTQQLREELQQQIQAKSLSHHHARQEQLAQDRKALAKFQTLDNNMVSAFPKITETPKHVQAQQQREA
jgi:hypothetical protein